MKDFLEQWRRTELISKKFILLTYLYLWFLISVFWLWYTCLRKLEIIFIWTFMYINGSYDYQKDCQKNRNQIGIGTSYTCIISPFRGSSWLDIASWRVQITIVRSIYACTVWNCTLLNDITLSWSRSDKGACRSWQ